MFHQHYKMHPGSVKHQGNVESQWDSFQSSKFLTLIRILEHGIYTTPLISALEVEVLDLMLQTIALWSTWEICLAARF